jgi:hypothetical protein
VVNSVRDSNSMLEERKQVSFVQRWDFSEFLGKRSPSLLVSHIGEMGHQVKCAVCDHKIVFVLLLKLTVPLENQRF